MVLYRKLKGVAELRKLAIWGFSFAAALGLSAYLLPETWAVLFAGAAILLLIVFLIIKSEHKRTAILILSGFAVGLSYLPVYSQLFIRSTELPTGRDLVLEAEATDYPSAYSKGAKLSVKILTGGGNESAVLYLYNGEADEVRPGDKLRFSARLFAFYGNKDSENDDYFSRAVKYGAGKVRDFEITSRPEKTQLKYLHKYAAKAVKDALRAVYPESDYPLALALLTGDKSELSLDRTLTSDLQRSGIYHVATVSGMHVSILTSFLMLMVPIRKRSALIVIPLLIFFAALVGFTPSVTRAVIMASFVLIAPMVGREDDKLTAIAASLVLILVVDPASVKQAGFQLSFASILGITLISPKIFNAFRSVKFFDKIKNKKRKGRIAKLVGCGAITLGAMAATIPLSAIRFGYFSIAAFPANLLIGIAVAPAFILSAISAGLGALILPVGSFLAGAASIFLKYIRFIAGVFSQGVLSAVYTDNAVIIVWLVFFYAAGIAAIIRRRDIKALIKPLCAAAVSLSLILVAVAVRTDMEEGFELTALDVGQGQCVAVTNGPCTAVFDCGSISNDRAGEICASFLNGLGRDGIDILCLSHYHMDHSSGVGFLLDEMHVGCLVLPIPNDEDTPIHDALVAEANKRGTKTVYADKDLSCELASARVTFFAPIGRESENERCVTALISENGFDVLITGDISGELERELADSKKLPDIECLIVSHHGSKYSSDDSFLAKVKPEIGIISVGENNSFGHPSEDTLRRLGDAGADVYRTDIIGNITVSSKESAVYG